MNPAGYLVYSGKTHRLEGNPGDVYNYVLAGNGVFVDVRSPLLAASVKVGDARVRGLGDYPEHFSLPQGRLPRDLYELLWHLVYDFTDREQYLAVTWEREDARYLLHRPMQQMFPARVVYETVPGALLHIHTHPGSIGTHFSTWDDKDEQGLGVYMVIGDLYSPSPRVKLRVGIYGYRRDVEMEEVFNLQSQEPL